ncbi:MAG: triose-phosphate isomerase [Gaiellales bacterium]
MSRTPFVAGNWKMHRTPSRTAGFVRELVERVPEGIDAAVCVPYTSLAAAVETASGTRLRVYAQNMHEAPEGAFTGEISAPMLNDIGVHGVLLGHSERRQYYNETDAALAEKVLVAHESGLEVILAIGETYEQRQAGDTENVLTRQLETVFSGLADDRAAITTIAYEPVWAIGTGRTATPELAQQAHLYIRRLMSRLYDENVGAAVRIQYGGSMKPDNAAGLPGQRDIDGGLIGGASLDVDQFAAILEAAVPVPVEE